MSWKAFVKASSYALITCLIGLIGQLDALDFKFEIITSGQWIGIIMKSMLPGLVSVRALFDTHETPAESTPTESHDLDQEKP